MGPAFTLDDLVAFHFLLMDEAYIEEFLVGAALLAVTPPGGLPRATPARAIEGEGRPRTWVLEEFFWTAPTAASRCIG
jgi:hypothetical protein